MLSQGQKFRKIITGSLNDEEIVSSQLYLDQDWLDFLEIGVSPILYRDQEASVHNDGINAPLKAGFENSQSQERL